MAEKANTSTVRHQDNHFVPDGREQDKELDLLRQDFVAAITESHVKEDAIAAALHVHPSYLSKLKSGEKPISAKHITDLPNEVEVIYERKRAERRGFVVVEPLAGLAAQKALVAGLLGVMSAPQLPAKADAMLRVDRPVVKKPAVGA